MENGLFNIHNKNILNLPQPSCLFLPLYGVEIILEMSLIGTIVVRFQTYGLKFVNILHSVYYH